MATGRCAGCGRTDSLRKISLHIVECEQYAQLFTTNPSRCLPPEEELQRYRTEDNSVLARAEQRGERLAARFAEINRHQMTSAARWQRPPDILE